MQTRDVRCLKKKKNQEYHQFDWIVFVFNSLVLVKFSGFFFHYILLARRCKKKNPLSASVILIWFYKEKHENVLVQKKSNNSRTAAHTMVYKVNYMNLNLPD